MALHRPSMPGTSKSRSPSPQRSAAESDRSLLGNYVTSYFKKAVVVLAVWAAGFYKFSPSWLLLALVVYVWKERQQAAKQHSIAIARDIARDERRAILARVDDLPSWVYFPDVERAEWVNKMVDQLWPYIGEYVRKLLREVVERKVKASLPSTMGSFKFSQIDLGDIPPRIGGVKVYTHQVRRSEIYLDMEINYASDSNLAVQVKGMNFGVRDLTLRGTLRIIFRPLITRIPLVGGVTVFFLNNPEFDFNLTNLANAFELPGLREILRSIIEEQISELLVLPNRLPIKIADNIDMMKLRYPLPQGVLRVDIIEAHDLLAADTKLFGKGKSDPYAVVMVGAQTFQTMVIHDTLKPQWNQTFEYVIDEREGQLLKMVLKDKDTGSKDDLLGSATMDISVVCQKGKVEEWLPLEEVPSGIIHVRASWLYLSSDPALFNEMWPQIAELTQEEDILHTALLIVHLDSAIDLPRGQRSLQEPSPFVLLTVGQLTQESSIRAATTEPSWEQNFRFFVANPNHQSLDVEVRDSKTKREIGEAKVYLKKVLAAENMVMEQKFPLRTSEPGSALYMTVVLRILTPNVTPEWMEDEGAQFMQTKHPEVPRHSTPKTEDTTGETGEGEVSSPAATAGEEAGEETGSVASPAAAEVRQRKPPASTSLVSKQESGEYGLGRLQVTLRYSAARQQLVVVVHKVVHLKAPEREGRKLPDPYVSVYLVQDKDNRTKRDTPVLKHTLSPVFDTQLTYDVSAGEVVKRILEVTVKNETSRFSSSPKVLGTAVVTLSTLDIKETVTQWLDLAPEGSATATKLNYK